MRTSQLKHVKICSGTLSSFVVKFRSEDRQPWLG
jgi:hypothetical protein